MTKLHPNIRPAIRDEVLHFLYTKDAESAATTLSDILQENCTLTNTTTLALTFHGKVYQPSHAPKRLIAPPIHPSLNDRMLAYVKDRTLIEREEKLIIKNLLTAILNTSDCVDDWLKLLPPAVHSPVELQRLYYPAISPPESEPILTFDMIEAFERKQERFLNMLKGRLALNLIF